MISTADLRLIARARLKDADVLRRNRRYDGAVYVCGYAIEMVLKARICRTLKWTGYPDSGGEFKPYLSLKTHDFDTLLHLSGIETKILTNYLPEWTIVKRWNPEVRYRPVGSATDIEAQNMIASVRTLLKVI